MEEWKKDRMVLLIDSVVMLFDLLSASLIVNSQAYSHRSFAHCGKFQNGRKRRWRKRRKRLRMTALEFVLTRTPSFTLKQVQIDRAFSFKDSMPEASLSHGFLLDSY